MRSVLLKHRHMPSNDGLLGIIPNPKHVETLATLLGVTTQKPKQTPVLLVERYRFGFRQLFSIQRCQVCSEAVLAFCCTSHLTPRTLSLLSRLWPVSEQTPMLVRGNVFTVLGTICFITCMFPVSSLKAKVNV